MSYLLFQSNLAILSDNKKKTWHNINHIERYEYSTKIKKISLIKREKLIHVVLSNNYSMKTFDLKENKMNGWKG